MAYLFLTKSMFLMLGFKAIDNLVQSNIQLGESSKSPLAENGQILANRLAS